MIPTGEPEEAAKKLQEEQQRQKSLQQQLLDEQPVTPNSVLARMFTLQPTSTTPQDGSQSDKMMVAKKKVDELHEFVKGKNNGG